MSSSLPLPTPILSQPEAIKELLQLAESSTSAKDSSKDGKVKGWCKEVEKLTASLSSPNFEAIKLLFGKRKAEPIYNLFPTAALAVTAAFIRTVSTNRLGRYVSRPLSDLSSSELTLKNDWEETLADIIGSIADWCEYSPEKKAKAYVGSSIYTSIGMLLSNTSSKRLGDSLKRAVLEIFESTLAETRSNRALFLNPGQGVMGPRKLGDLLLAKPVHQASHLLTLDIIAHCLPKGPDERKTYAETIFRSLDVVDVRQALETLLTETSRSDFYQTRPKILKVLAKFDVDRLQLFPLLSVTRSSNGTAQLLSSKDDRSLIKKNLKFLYIDSAEVVFSYMVDEAKSTISVPFDAISDTKFEPSETGEDQTTTLIITNESGETFEYKIKCPQSTIQRVCASRPFKTPVKPPPEDLRSFHRASTMEATGIALRSPEMVKRERESVPPAERFSQRPASVAPRSGIEEEREQAVESSQSAVRSQKERIEVMKGFTVPSQSPESRDGTDKSQSKKAEVPVSPLESKPTTTNSKSAKPPSSKRVAALAAAAAAGASEPLSKELFGEESDGELSEVNTPPGSKTAVAGGGAQKEKEKGKAGAGASKRKRAELDKGGNDEDPNAADGREGGDTTVVHAPTPKKKTKKNDLPPPPSPRAEQDPMDVDVDDAQTQSQNLPPPPPKQSVPKHKYSSTSASNKKNLTSKRGGKKTLPSHSPSASNDEPEPDPYDELPTAASSESGGANPISSKREAQAKGKAKATTVKPKAAVGAKGRGAAAGGGRKRKKVDEEQQHEEEDEDEDEDEDEQEVESQPVKNLTATTTTAASSSSKKSKKTVAAEVEVEPPAEKSKIKIKRRGLDGAASASTKKDDHSAATKKKKEKMVEKKKDTTEAEADMSTRSTRSSTRKNAVVARKKFGVDLEGSGEEEGENGEEGGGEEEEFGLEEKGASKVKEVRRKEKEKDKSEKVKETRKEKKIKEPTPEPIVPVVEEYVYPGDDDGFANEDGGGEGEEDATITAPKPTQETSKVGANPKKKPVVHLDAISERGESEWASDAGGGRRAESRKSSKDVGGAGSSAKIKEIDENVPISKKDPKQKSITKSPSNASSRASVSTSNAAQRSSKTTTMPPAIKRAKKSNFGPWEQPDIVQERLEANLATEGMEDILEEAQSEIAAFETATERVSNHERDTSPRSSSKVASAASPAAQPKKKTGAPVVNSDEEFEPAKEKTTTGGRSRRKSSALAESFSAGPFAHSTPKPPPTTPKDRRPQPNIELVGQQQQKSSSVVKGKGKGKAKAKAAPPDAKEMDPSSAGLAKQPTLPRSGVTPLEAGRLPSAQPSTVGKKRVADGVASSSKQKQNLDPRTSHAALQASNARSATPFVVKSANPVGTDLAQGNVGAIAGPISSARKHKGSVSRSGKTEEGEENASLVKETYDVIANELSKRYIKRIKKTQAQAKVVQTRLTADTQKLAHHLVHRTGVIVEASKRHGLILKELNKNIATTTREAKTKSEGVVQELEKLAAREERRASQWPESFFA